MLAAEDRLDPLAGLGRRYRGGVVSCRKSNARPCGSDAEFERKKLPAIAHPFAAKAGLFSPEGGVTAYQG